MKVTFLSKVSRRVVMGVSALALTVSSVILPLAAVKAATDSVAIEGTIQVANVTAGDTSYKNSVNAKVDEVVKVQVWYHNREDANSGKIAKNLKVGIAIPTAAGKAQTIGGQISADNSNTVSKTASVNLSVDEANLEYIPGSAKWRHNTGADANKPECITGNDPAGAPASCYTETIISDDVAKGGAGVRLEDQKPCFAHEATVTVLMRVKASAVKVNKYVSKYDGDSNVQNNNWQIANTANAGDKLDYMIRFENKGNTKLEDVMVGDNLPDYMKYVNGSTKLYAGSDTNGLAISNDNVVNGGINVGAYAPGATGYVIFTVQLAPNAQFAKCGNYVLTNVGVVRPKGMIEFYNTAKTTVNIPCQPVTPGSINVCELSTKKIVSIKESEFNSSKYSKNLADCSVEMCKVPGKEHMPKNSSECVTTTVTELPETGINSGVVVFAGLGMITAALGYAFTSTRLRKLLIG
jgi:uncharacterized repeat protein (TIGR01451 family)